MKRIFLLLALLWAAPAFAQDAEPKVQARLVAEHKAVAPGGSTTIALEELITPKWHTYWKNPGDAGAPTAIEWTLPPGWKADAIQWPRPKRLPVGPLMDYGYEGKVWLLTNITAPADAKPGEAVTIKAAASWLVCENICIPEERSLSITLLVGPATPDAAVAQGFAAARALLPIASPWKMAYALGENLDLYVAAPTLVSARPTGVDFFPSRAGLIKNPAPQRIGYAKDGLVLRMTPGAKVSAPLEGLLVLTSSDGSVQALEVSAMAGTVPPAEFAQSAASGDLTLWLAILFALIGGLILNVMPCVLPILAMKALAMAQHGAEGRRESFSYAAGAVISFAVLGLAILLLREGGAAIGWGFQLQSPIAVAGFALLLFAVGLNLSGLYEVGSVTAGEGLTRKSGVAGAFFTGVLAVAVAAPCTAPFMAAALGFALAQGAVAALTVFVALGVGFALPFLLLGIWPRALAFLPRPGTWMLRLKQFLAFPMYAAAAWLVWVLAQQAGPRGVAIVSAAMIFLALAAWLWSVTRDLAARGRGLGAVAAVLVLLLALFGVSQLRGAEPAQAAQITRGEAYGAAKLASYRAENRPVFVDATAAWCITCLVNEEAVLSKPSVQNAFAARKVVYMVADWTNQNPEITALLKENGRSGVPLYLYYASGAVKPKILSQILTEAEVLAALDS
ncbi:MAG TPA: protein-disulfide reductase DsbD domain-containing protein [Rhizomicrobium sp.]|jgi:thiol:disulfide interchange protein DsbD|nr:protein-disulfide reductase DsbD domain-containing protein [Rhizomicrobium sp.]